MLNYYYYYFFFFSRKESFIIRSLHHKTLVVLFEQVNIRLVRLFFLEKNIPDNRYSRVNEILNKRYFKLKVTAITENMLVSSLKKNKQRAVHRCQTVTHIIYSSRVQGL